MVMRKSKIQEIELLRNELETRTMFLEQIVDKFQQTGTLTAEERECAQAHRDFIAKNAKVVKEFYAPAMTA